MILLATFKDGLILFITLCIDEKKKLFTVTNERKVTQKLCSSLNVDSHIINNLIEKRSFNNAEVFSLFTDFKLLFDKVHGDARGLEGSKLRLEHVPICSCILVQGLKESTSNETVQLYFENKRGGGNVVSHVEPRTKNSALVYFEDPASKEILFSF